MAVVLGCMTCVGESPTATLSAWLEAQSASLGLCESLYKICTCASCPANPGVEVSGEFASVIELHTIPLMDDLVERLHQALAVPELGAARRLQVRGLLVRATRVRSALSSSC